MWEGSPSYVSVCGGGEEELEWGILSSWGIYPSILEDLRQQNANSSTALSNPVAVTCANYLNLDRFK